ncbi:hypothetical protein [Streptomyces sp. NPDC007205]|uniref:hypothetical protein n=1 Tax=Streptomyces sp. NPDC007205 TaxID=3154316 RepID=UPI00340A7977
MPDNLDERERTVLLAVRQRVWAGHQDFELQEIADGAGLELTEVVRVTEALERVGYLKLIRDFGPGATWVILERDISDEARRAIGDWS